MMLWRCVECAEKLTMRAHAAFRSSGRAERTQRTMPMTPSSKAWPHCSSVRSSKLPTAPGPTALISTLSSPFHRSPSSANTLLTRSSSRISATTPRASGLPRLVRSSVARSRSAWDRATIATRAPSSARQRAAARPMPRPPPTTTAVAFVRPKSMANARLSLACRHAYQKVYDRYYSSRRGRRHGCVTADHRATDGRFDAGGREAGTACAAWISMEVPAVAKQATAEKRQRRERGSINPDDIISGAFELAEQVSIDNLSMPLLGKHLGVGVTSIYWYFRKKDDLLNAMTDRALRKYVFATPYVEASDWRETLRNHARSMRKTFMGNPILCDLILIRSALSPRAARLGVQEIEKAIES